MTKTKKLSCYAYVFSARMLELIEKKLRYITWQLNFGFYDNASQFEIIDVCSFDASHEF